MPRAPRRCPGDGYTCPHTITSSRHCPDHTQAWQGRTTGQGSTWSGRKARTAVLKRDGYRCQLRYDGCTGRATEVDHRDNIAHTGLSRNAATDVAAMQAACHHCHNIKTQREAASVRRK